MANILYYHGILNDMGQLKAYISDMWEASHSYSVHMGEIYYCDGSCLEQGNVSADISADAGTSLVPAASENMESADPAPPSPSSLETEETAGSAQSGGGDGSETGRADDNAAATAAGQAADNAETAAAQTDPSSNHHSKGPGETISTDAGFEPETAKAQEPPVNPCPGHMDFSINITIKGITEDNGLFRTDELAGSAAGQGTWNGWDGPAMEQVRYLSAQDWYQVYGINTTDLFVRNPLTSAEIDIYMTMVPENTSRQKKDFIRYALSSVGKIPYYWGGKPSSPGYTGNGFGSITAPDEDGRFLKGLDCSGWINWVYWSVTGTHLPYEGTEGLKTLGRQVKRQDLKPGDIVVITGSTPHVIMFLGFTSNGQIQCIHETGSANNVTIGVMNANWPYYRNLLD